MFFHIILFFIVPLSTSAPALPLQGISVRGRLVCGQYPIYGAVVKLIDIDIKDKDDLLDVGLTDENGIFSLSGFTREDEVMQGAIKIYHNCGDRLKIYRVDGKKKKVCARKVVWEVPVEYNTDGNFERWFDTGTVNMEMKFRGEERDCKH